MFHIKYIKASSSLFWGWGILPLSVCLASSPGPAQNREKGLDTLAKIPVYAVSAVFFWSAGITFVHYQLLNS